MLKFTIEGRISGKKGRAGTIQTSHGNIQTPAFIPVGTKATVKSLTPEQVASLGADAILANTYHLYLQPGTEVLKKAGGLGKFMNWSGPTFTDSGGFQAFSLGPAFGKRLGKISGEDWRDVNEMGIDDPKSDTGEDTLRRPLRPSIGIFQQKNIRVSESVSDGGEAMRMAHVDDDGVTFKSVIDGSTHRFTPERSIEIQHDIGADIIFAFDECLSPQESYERQKAAVDRTYIWAQRCLSGRSDLDISRSDLPEIPALFGIIQGGRHEDLRRLSARTIGALDFDGFGIGGSFDKADIGTAVGWVCEELPENKPRHLLGIGEPIDLILGIENGIDTFDCVAPTRIARNGSAYVKKFQGDPISRSDLPEISGRGRINLLNAQFISDFNPIDSDCGCYTCKNYTRSYLAHLFRAKEMLAATLTSIHNLYFLVNLVKDARKAIVEGRWEEFKGGHTQ
jgi:queuine tRNA-ribosyltransferase